MLYPGCLKNRITKQNSQNNFNKQTNRDIGRQGFFQNGFRTKIDHPSLQYSFSIGVETTNKSANT